MTYDTLRLVEVDQAEGFTAVAESVRWDEGMAPANLCVILTRHDLGALALRAPDDKDNICGVLAFVDLYPEEESVDVPINLQQVARLTGRVATVQNPHVAKGVGILGGNTAGAVASHYARSTVAAVRVIRVRGLGDVCVDPEVALAGGIARHFGKMLRTNAWDANDASASTMDRLTQIIRERAEQLGGCACAIMPLSPVNRIRQAVFTESEVARRGHVLASGLVEPPRTLDRIGRSDIPQKSNPITRQRSR